MSFVSGRFLADFLDLISRHQIDVDALVGDLPVGSALGHPRHRLVEWDLFAELMERLERRLGGVEPLENLGELLADMKPAPVLRRLAGLSASPFALYQAAQRWALTRALPGLETTVDPPANGRIRIVSTIAKGDRPCPQIFHVAVGGARALPRILDLPDAVVSANIDERRGAFTITLPPSGTLWARARRATRAVLSARAAFQQLELQQLELQGQYDTLQRAYADLQESESRHRALSDSVVDVMAEFAADGRIQFVSPSITDLTGYRQAQVIGSNFSLWLHRDDVERAKEHFARTIAQSHSPMPSPVLRVRREQADWIWIETTARSFIAQDGDVHVVATLRDVSDRVRQAEELQRQRTGLEDAVTRRTEQLERRTRDLRELQALLLQTEDGDASRDLAGRIAHSINNPLGALIGNLELAAANEPVDPRVMRRALELARRTGDVVNRTLDFYREGKIHRVPVDARELVAELRQDLVERATHCHVEIECRVDDDVTVFDADRGLLLSGLLGIAENAVDAMREGGRLGIEMGLLRERDTIEVRIWDTGPGIPIEMRTKVLQAFFTTKPRGTGLGLAIASSVVRGHAGRIAIGDRPDGGTLVRIEIPRCGPPAQTSARRSPSS